MTIEQYLQQSKGIFQDAFRMEILKKYSTLPIPSKKLEDWKFFDTTSWFQKEWNFNPTEKLTQDFLHSIIKDLQFDSLLVFENGVFSPKFSSKESETITYNPFTKESNYSNSEIIDNSTNFPRNVFEAFNILSCSQGAKIIVNPSKSAQHIVLLSVISGNKTFALQHNTIQIQKETDVKITELIVSLENAETLTNSLTTVLCDEGTTCEYVSLQKTHELSNVIQSIEISQQKNSTITLHSYPLSGKYIRSNIHVHKQAEQAHTNLYGLFFPSKDEQFEIYTHVNHNKPECETSEIYKGLANENGQGVFSGMIYVARDAQKTRATQSNKNILLSDSAKIHSKPQLEIYADDVSCNHGSTTGQINREALWYMQARGIGKQQAIELLLEGFITEITEKIWNKNIQNAILQALKEKLVI